MGDALDGQAMVRSKELQARMSAGKKKKWWRWRSRALVHSKSKRDFP
jgi:hypothetical protein